ncbi:hypothetical protein O5D80_006718 [Batrachochytrium dendrobatidis]|nr:hypothetical protein O5D80_006718 [Batrachochytrium dendrobatidis]
MGKQPQASDASQQKPQQQTNTTEYRHPASTGGNTRSVDSSTDPQLESDFLANKDSSKRRLIWVEYNHRADIVDILPGDSIGKVLQRIHERFGHQLSFADTSQLRIGIPKSWVPGQTREFPVENKTNPDGLYYSSKVGTPNEAFRQSAFPNACDPSNVNGSTDPIMDEEKKCYKQDHTSYKQSVVHSPCHPLSGDINQAETHPILVIPNRFQHEGVAIGEVFKQIVAENPSSASTLSLLFSSTYFPTIIHILNTRQEAFQLFVDYSNVPKYPGMRFLDRPSNSQATFNSDHELTKFFHNLRYAKLEDDVLSMPPGTYLLGDPSLGSKLYTRQVYKELALGIEQSKPWQRGFVVTGTPGMGKTFFGIWMMYLIVNDVICLGNEGRLDRSHNDLNVSNVWNSRLSQSINRSQSLNIVHNDSDSMDSKCASHVNFMESNASVNHQHSIWNEGSQIIGQMDSENGVYTTAPVIIFDLHLRNELIVFSMEDRSVTSGWARNSSHPAFYHSHVWYISDGDKAPLMVPAPIVSGIHDDTSSVAPYVCIRKSIHITSSDTIQPSVMRLPGNTVLTMPAWTFAELESAYLGCSNYSLCTSYSEFTELVYKWGCNPLMVLTQSKNQEIQQLAQSSLFQIDMVRVLHRLVGLDMPASRSNLTCVDPHTDIQSTYHQECASAHLVVHAVTDAQNYVSRSYRMGSAYISQVAAHKLYRPVGWNAMDLTNLVHSAWRFEHGTKVDQQYPHLRQVRKMLYMGHIHNTLCEGGQFPIRRLSPGLKTVLATQLETSTVACLPDQSYDTQKASVDQPIIPQLILSASDGTTVEPANTYFDQTSFDITSTQKPPHSISINESTITIPHMSRFLFESMLSLSHTEYNIPKVSQFSPVDSICAPNILFCICVNDRGRTILVDKLREMYVESCKDEGTPSYPIDGADALTFEAVKPGIHSNLKDMEKTPLGNDVNHTLKLFYVVPTTDLFHNLGPQQFKVDERWLMEEAVILEWADKHIEQYVLHLGI